jgi:quinolinate synthase
MGIDPRSPVVWNPLLPDMGGTDPDRLESSDIILWKGFCNVHTAFTVEQVEQARAEHEDLRVIVHPECPRPVVEAADEDGSTEYIINRCEELPAGSTIAIGTDWNLVNRLRQRHDDKTIFCLKEDICPCVTMNRITLPKLTWCLESLAAGEVVNVVEVEAEMARWARTALDRMLAL